LTARCQELRRTMRDVHSRTMSGEKIMHAKDALSWFEIPAADLSRATRFYETVLNRPMQTETMGPHTLSVFAYEQPGVGGCLITGDGHAPSATGTVVYLN